MLSAIGTCRPLCFLFFVLIGCFVLFVFCSLLGLVSGFEFCCGARDHPVSPSWYMCLSISYNILPLCSVLRIPLSSDDIDGEVALFSRGFHQQKASSLLGIKGASDMDNVSVSTYCTVLHCTEG